MQLNCQMERKFHDFGQSILMIRIQILLKNIIYDICYLLCMHTIEIWRRFPYRTPYKLTNDNKYLIFSYID